MRPIRIKGSLGPGLEPPAEAKRPPAWVGKRPSYEPGSLPCRGHLRTLGAETPPGWYIPSCRYRAVFGMVVKHWYGNFYGAWCGKQENRKRTP